MAFVPRGARQTRNKKYLLKFDVIVSSFSDQRFALEPGIILFLRIAGSNY